MLPSCIATFAGLCADSSHFSTGSPSQAECKATLKNDHMLHSILSKRQSLGCMLESRHVQICIDCLFMSWRVPINLSKRDLIIVSPEKDSK